MPTIFSIVGKANSGKTKLITRLVVEMKKRELSVGIIKALKTEGEESKNIEIQIREE